MEIIPIKAEENIKSINKEYQNTINKILYIQNNKLKENNIILKKSFIYNTHKNKSDNHQDFQMDNISNFIKYILLKYFSVEKNIIIIYKIDDKKYIRNLNFKTSNYINLEYTINQNSSYLTKNNIIDIYPFNSVDYQILELENMINDLDIKSDNNWKYYINNKDMTYEMGRKKNLRKTKSKDKPKSNENKININDIKNYKSYLR